MVKVHSFSFVLFLAHARESWSKILSDIPRVACSPAQTSLICYITQDVSSSRQMNVNDKYTLGCVSTQHKPMTLFSLHPFPQLAPLPGEESIGYTACSCTIHLCNALLSRRALSSRPQAPPRAVHFDQGLNSRQLKAVGVSAS